MLIGDEPVKFHLLCGIPGSGKSALAGRLPGYVVSTDRIRRFLWQDEAVVEHDDLVFRLAENIIDYLLARGENVIFDATNLTVRKRRRYLDLAGRHRAAVTLHWVDCPLETAVARNARRDRRVPVKIIKSLYNSFQKPEIKEGIEVIKVYSPELSLLKIIIPGWIIKRRCFP